MLALVIKRIALAGFAVGLIAVANAVFDLRLAWAGIGLPTETGTALLLCGGFALVYLLGWGMRREGRASVGLPYEFFVGWRYLYNRRIAKGSWVLLLACLVLVGCGAGLFLASEYQAAGSLMMFGGGALAAFAITLMLFSTFTAISVMGLSIGVAVLIGVLSVTSGFQHEFRSKVLGVNAHVLVLKYGVDFAEYRDVMRKMKFHQQVVATAPFIFNEMMLAKGNRLSGVLVKGVDPELVGNVLDLPKHITEPKQADLSKLLAASKTPQGKPSGHVPGIVVGRELARKLDVKVGDPVRLISPLAGLDMSGWAANSKLPRSRDFRISGIFYSGFDEYDRRLIYVNLREAQSFFSQGDVVTGVELKIRDVFRAPQVKKAIAAQLGKEIYRTVDWGELNHNLFSALQVQKIFLQGVIGAIVVVAAFNVLAALAVLVMRKKRQIAVLKSVGASSLGIARVFFGTGLIVWFAGTAIGLTFGYLGCLLLRKYGFPLDPKVYLINELPVQLNPLEFIATAGFALLVCLLATLYPALRAASLDPVRGLRH